jgi:release factor glutamine methyltransferase
MRADPLIASLLDRLSLSFVVQPDKPEETPETTIRALCFSAAGTPLSVRLALGNELPVLNEEARCRLAKMVDDRLSGIPLAHITQRQHFMGVEMLAGPEALIPRVETEILGYEALAIAKSLADERASVTVLDLCTGSGNIPLGIAANEQRCRIIGADLSPEAIELAWKNARHLGLEGSVDFRQSDMFSSFESEEFYGNIDLLTCNPPYISSAKVGTMNAEISGHEPRLAFDGGALGVTILTKLIRGASRFLKPDSFLCFEVGLGQGNSLARMLGNAKVYRNIRTLSDSAGHVRAIVARI